MCLQGPDGYDDAPEDAGSPPPVPPTPAVVVDPSLRPAPSHQTWHEAYRGELDHQRWIRLTSAERQCVRSAKGQLDVASRLYGAAVVAVLVGTWLTWLDKGSPTTYDDVVVAVCDAVNYVGLAGVTAVGAARFGAVVADDDKRGAGTEKAHNIAPRWSKCDVKKLLDGLDSLNGLYRHLRAAWLLAAVLRLCRVTQDSARPATVVSGLAVASSLALLGRVVDAVPSVGKRVPGALAGPLRWVSGLVAPRDVLDAARAKSAAGVTASAAVTPRASGAGDAAPSRTLEPVLSWNAPEAGSQMDCCGEPAHFGPEELEARSRFDLLPGQNDVVTGLVGSLSLAQSSASLLLFGALAEAVGYAWHSAEDPVVGLPALASALVAVRGWVIMRGSLGAVAHRLEDIVTRGVDGEDLHLLMAALAGAPAKLVAADEASGVTKVSAHVENAKAPWVQKFRDAILGAELGYSLSAQFYTLGFTAALVAASAGVAGAWSGLALVPNFLGCAHSHPTLQAHLVASVTDLVEQGRELAGL